MISLTDYRVLLCGPFGLVVELVRTDDLHFARDILAKVNILCGICDNSLWVSIEEVF